MHRYTTFFFSLICISVFGAIQIKGHTRGESYVFLEFQESTIDGRFEFRYSDLKEKLGIDVFVNKEPSIEILEENTPKIIDYVNRNFSIGPVSGSDYEILFEKQKLFNSEGGWAQFEFTLNSGPVPAELEVTYNMGFENDSRHRGILVIEKGDWPNEDYQMRMAMIFDSDDNNQILDTNNPPELMTPVAMIWQGVLHIWIGIDHILFLLALALPIVLIKQDNTWQPVNKLGSSLRSLVSIVTVFTIAHSVTLALASLDIITLPSRLVESIIALSIILVALNNVLGRKQNTSLIIILLLGLFHGLGFASVMADLPFRIADISVFILIILAFNVGVEIGQLAILVVVFPVLYALRNTSLYTPIVLKGGSTVLILIATYWFIERAFGL